MSSHGLWKIHHAIQTDEAWKDWRKLAEKVIAEGHADLVRKFTPPDSAGWRVVDRCSQKLRAAITALEV